MFATFLFVVILLVALAWGTRRPSKWARQELDLELQSLLSLGGELEGSEVRAPAFPSPPGPHHHGWTFFTCWTPDVLDQIRRVRTTLPHGAHLRLPAMGALLLSMAAAGEARRTRGLSVSGLGRGHRHHRLAHTQFPPIFDWQGFSKRLRVTTERIVTLRVPDAGR